VRWLFLLVLSLPAEARSWDMVNIQKNLPKRHALMRVFVGDLNNDARPDAVVLARSWDEASNANTPRPLLVFLRQPNGILKRVVRADGVVACAACGGVAGDPWARRDQLAGVVFAKNSFSLLEFVGSGWRGWRKVSFRFSKERFWLFECSQKTWHTSHQFAPEFTRVIPKTVLLERFVFSDCHILIAPKS
jgi:hypothetical protein